MRIRGFLNRDYEPPAPFIKVLLISKNPNLRKFLDLHIDTGASSTIIAIYDSLFIELAKNTNTELVTSDNKQAEIARREGKIKII